MLVLKILLLHKWLYQCALHKKIVFLYTLRPAVIIVISLASSFIQNVT